MGHRFLLEFAIGALILLCIWGALFLTSANYAGGSEWPDSKLWLTTAGRAVLLLVAAIASCALFVQAVLRNRRLGNLTKNVLTIALTLFLCVLTLEFTFMFVPRSHGYGASLSARIWTSYYWHPVNELGYRSPPVTLPGEGVKSVLVVGDSFTEGHGINEIGNRYPELLASKLGSGYRVFNAGLSGADSEMEYENLLAFPVSPDILILQYFGNDIEYSCQEQGLTFGNFKPYKGLGKAATFIARNSFLVNFVYWLLPQSAEEDIRYAEFLIECYKDDKILESHLDVLEQFVAFSRERQIPLYVIIFPFLEPKSEKINYYAPLIAEFFKVQSINVISVSNLVQGLGPSERMVNGSDGHANERVHSLVADALYSAMRPK